MQKEQMGQFRVNADFIRQARVTKINDDKTVDVLVMIHPDDFPEFTKDECTGGHGHRMAVTVGNGDGQFNPDPIAAPGQDPRYQALADQVTALATRVQTLESGATAMSSRMDAVETADKGISARMDAGRVK